MKFVSISDVHIKEPNDHAQELFLLFLDSDETSQSDYIFLLGDIFDLLVGPGFEVEKRYPKVFSKIKSLLESGKKIIQFEGNHDFHFQKLIDELLNQWNIDKKQWLYKNKPEVFDFNNKKILFCHGDEIEIGNYSYKFYRLWIRSFFIKFLADYIVPSKWVQAIGDNASKKSRERNNYRYNEEQVDIEVKPRFREAAKKAARKFRAEAVICGHSHCLDNYSEKIKFFNNGYFPITKTFIVGNAQSIELVKVSKTS